MYEFDLDLSFGNGNSALKLPEAYYKDGKSNGLSIYGQEKKLDGLDGLELAA